MKQATLVRAIRLPLLAALAVNLTVVVVTPVYRARESAENARPPAAPTETFDSLLVSSPPPAKTLPQPEESRPSPPATPEDNLTVLTEPTVDEDSLPVVEPPDEPASEDEATEESDAGFVAADEHLVVVGQTLAQVGHRSSALSLPIAHTAGRLTQWLAHADGSAPANSGTNTDPDPPAEPVEPNGQPPDEDGAEPPRIVIRNRPENGFPVSFLLEERVRTLAPGEELISPTAEATVRFDRGRSLGESRRELSPGVYHFVVTKKGWKLQQQDQPDGSAARASR